MTAPALDVLEVGCGTGHWLGILRARGHHVSGLDFSAQMLAQAQTSLPGAGLIRGRAEHLPFPAESFDRLFCINAIHHFEDKPGFLREARRILRPGGKVLSVGIDPHRREGQWYIYDYFKESLAIDQARYPDSSVLQAWMSAAGFENCATHEVEHWAHRLPARAALAQGRLDKAATSQLTVLTDEEYRGGLQRLEEDIQHAEKKGETLFLAVDLRVYGTSGAVQEEGTEARREK
jgi:SAM-dependent methyltransferase